MNIDKIIFNSMKPSPVLEAYLEKRLAPVTHMPNGESLIKGLRSHDEYVASVKEDKASIPFPTEALKEEAEALVRHIIETPLVKLPKGTKKVAFEQNGVKGYLIGTPVGDKHTKVQWVTEKGEILHTATIANPDFPNIVVVDDFVYNHQEDEYGASHGRIVSRFLKRNPFLNLEGQHDEVYLNYPCRDKTGQKIMEVVLDDQGNQVIENGVVKMKVKTEKRLVSFFRQILTRLEGGERIDGFNHSKAGCVDVKIGESMINQHQKLIKFLQNHITANDTPDSLALRKDLKALTHYGRNSIDKGSPLAFFQAGGNYGLEESPTDFRVTPEAVFLHPDSYLVGGLNDARQKHPESSGWHPSNQLNQILYVNASAPFEYTIRSNQHGFNFTGGDPDIDGVDITREEMEATLKACGLNISYEDFIKQLPSKIRGTSFATPWLLAENFKALIADAVKTNEGTLPRGLDSDFYKRVETLGIEIPVQGEPQYNPKK